MEEFTNYKYLIGKKVTRVEEKKDYIIFYTDNEKIYIDKFIPYCCCNVGEYIDNIKFSNKKVNGIITAIKENINKINNCNEVVYRGEVTFFFENSKINMKVHGEDNGYYGVSFTMPVYIEKI